MNRESKDNQIMSINDRKYRSYIQLLTANQRRIYGFIYAMLSDHSVAEDILQETTMFMWENFDKFQEGTNFSAWGISIARNFVLKHCRSRKNKAMLFDSEVLENLEEQSDIFEFQEEQFDALKKCFKKLREVDRQLMQMRYIDKIKIKSISERFNLSTSHLYRGIAKINNNLLKCIKRQLSA